MIYYVSKVIAIGSLAGQVIRVLANQVKIAEGFGGLLLFIIFVLPSQNVAAQPPGSWVVLLKDGGSSVQVDLGETWRGQNVTRVFSLQNDTGRKLSLRLKVTCGCVNASVPKPDLDIGEVTAMTVVVSTSATQLAGGIHEMIELLDGLETAKDQSPRSLGALILRGTHRETMRFDPSFVDLAALPVVNGKWTFDLSLMNSSGLDMQWRFMPPVNGGVRLDVGTGVLGGDDQQLVKVTIDTPTSGTNTSAVVAFEVELQDGDKTISVLREFPLRGGPFVPVIPWPSSLLFAGENARLGSKVALRLQYQRGMEVEILTIEAEHEAVSVVKAVSLGDHTMVELELAKLPQGSLLEDIILVRMKVNGVDRELAIPVIGLIPRP